MAGSPRAAFRRSSRAPSISSSSWAQTAASQLTVSTPSRSAVGWAASAIAGPATAGQACWTRASRVAGASWSTSGPSAEEIGRGAAAAHAAIASCMTAPGEIRRRATARSPAPGTWPRSVVAITL